MKPKNPVVWFEIYVNDIKRARKFYETVFNYEFSELGNPADESFQMLAFPSDPETKNMAAGALVYHKDTSAGANSTIVYFHSKDCSVEEARVENAGGEVFRPKMSIGQYGFISLVKDTEGNMIGIHSME
ncbi:lactoylglutathione lyase [Christiangramia fulva]|uniref:Lactoylglutathione lyase n=1 Tax=Christiangramia fulva TaxID=2126553 RepID=A0A2R3Z450_9FLAO|nr:VOC family protein [Christiangramia fulva]AVR45050.1 lactoylglutathione lyase [Christiangramia fulva]